MNRRLARLQQLEREREIDYRYVKFNLKTQEGQEGYRQYILAEIKSGIIDPKFPGSPLSQHERSQVFDPLHKWEAEAILYRICGVELGKLRIERPQVDLFISFAPVKKPRAKKVSPVVAEMQLPEGKKARLVRGKLVIK